MNETTPPSFSAALPPLPTISLEPSLRLFRLLLTLLLGVMIIDLCFWHLDNDPGFSVAVCFAGLMGIILANREKVRGTWLSRCLLILLFGALLAATIETGFTNTVVLLALTVALGGTTFFDDVESVWGRWLSQGVALILAPGRLFWLSARVMESAFREKGGIGSMIGGGLLALPAIALVLIFGSLLASGNAIFGSWANLFFDWFWKELALCFDLGRVIFWLAAAIAILPLLRPARISPRWWKWTENLPQLPQIIPASAAFSCSGMTLLALNLLFLVANLADAAFLWSGQKLPVGVTFSEYVHHGVNSLIATVLLSAFVLVTIFQQEQKVAGRRELKVLGMIWIAQNLFLLLSVALRLKLYIEAFDMTVERLGVIIFLALVVAGYVLLTIKLIRDKSLSWLVGGCVLAVFATLYVTQFLDLAGWSANYNVAQWQKDRSRNLDLYYLYRIGPGAWPALRHAKDLGAVLPQPAYSSGQSQDPLALSRDREESEGRATATWEHWREFSLLAYMNRSALDDKK